MFSRHYVGRDLFNAANYGPRQPVSRVTLFVDDDNVFTAGDDTGLELTAKCPYATESMAKALLSIAKGVQYTAYEATAANLDPAAELGDGVTLDGIYSVLSKISDNGDGYPDISFPGENLIEEEYPGIETPEENFDRQIAETKSLIAKTATDIEAGIYGPEGSFTKLNLSLGNLSAEVHGADGKGGLTGAVAKLNLSLEGLSTEVHGADGKGGLTGKYSAIDQKVSNIKLSVVNENGEVSIALNSGDSSMGSGTINLKGMVTFEALSGVPGEGTKGSINGGWINADTLIVKAANIDGKLNVGDINLTGNITWEFLDGTTQKKITDAAKTGGLTKSDVRTLITNKLVSSPTIAGGVFQDEPEYPDAALFLDREYDDDGDLVNAGVVLERKLYKKRSDGTLRLTKTLQTLQVWDSGLDIVSLASRNRMFLSIIGGSEMTAYGLWSFEDTVRFYGTVDFSNANVIGL